jgi:hypothetical protein
MKHKDLIIIGLTAFLAAILSFVISGILFGSPKKNPIKVPVVDKIEPTFPQVKTDTNYTSFFNNQALNPTQLIQIGGSSNNQPFQGGSR